ncbi:MAG: ATP-dependent helicase [Bacteroidetes bacterium]|nr:MAG: ATP-dependent helicase [Bacteroidota bacterium]
MKFTDLNLSKPLLNALADIGITQPTAIQSKAFSPIMAGKDVIGISQTGTGKTFAFLLPVLRLWKFTKSPNPQVLIVVPTRELVAQIVEAAKQLTPYMNTVIVGVYGGTNIRPQKTALEAGVDVVVGTPGRLVDLLEHGHLRPKDLKWVIIDEVDEMLNLGFRTQLRNIIALLPKKRQHIMFSATMTEEVELVIREFTTFYDQIEAAPSGAPLENIKQFGYAIPNFNSKANLLELLIKADSDMRKVLVFAKTKKMADALYERLLPNFEDALGIIHSSKSQNNRFATVHKFQEGTCKYLIATDIIARGLDVSAVTHVINFDLPDTPEKYIHRIGRTGRSEMEGISMSFVSEDDQPYQIEIEALMDLEISMLPLPEDLELSDELIQLEKPKEYVPFDVHKTKRVVPSGPAFHEKKAKNRKTNNKIRRKEKMQLKYGKPIKKRGKKKK